MSAVTKKGQWVIPKSICEDFNIIKGESDVVAVKIDGGFTFKVVNPSPLDKLVGIASNEGLVSTTDELLKLTRGDN